MKRAPTTFLAGASGAPTGVGSAPDILAPDISALVPSAFASAALAIASLSMLACGESDNSASVGGLAPGSVTQGGAQDIGEFRRVVSKGQVPDLEMLDPVGFFAEHALDLPQPSCQASVCAHPFLAVAPTFDGGNWTMGFIGLNTAVTVDELNVKPRHLVLVIEATDTVTIPEDFSEVLSEQLQPEDRVSVVEFSPDGENELTFGLTADQLRESERWGDFESLDVVERLRESTLVAEASRTDLYAALFEALQLTRVPALEGYQTRVLVMTSGLSKGGVTNPDTVAELAHVFAEGDVGISVFGMGEFFERPLATALTEVAAGNIYVTRGGDDFLDAVQVEGKTGFVPLARDLRIEVESSPAYAIVDVYGARRAEVSARRAELESPVLFLGARRGSSDTQTGRRGGGGGWFVQVQADPDLIGGPDSEEPVLEVRVSFEDALTGRSETQTTTLTTPLGVGNNPEPTDPYFTNPTYAKPFMMLNMYMALSAMVSYYRQGACSLAVGMRDMMEQSYVLWQEHYADPDITDDFVLIVNLESALNQNCDANEPLWPVEAEVGCFFF